MTSTDLRSEARVPPARARRRSWPTVALIALLAVAALWWIPTLTDIRTASLMSRFLLLGLAAVGLDLLWGKAGLLSFGHAALFGLGAYGSGLVLKHLDLPAQTLIAVAVGTLVATVFGLLAGLALFGGRVKGVYFGIITLLFALLLEQLAITLSWFTGGLNGLVVPTGLQFGPIEVRDAGSTYRFVLIVVAAVYLVVRWFAGTPLGQAIEASRMNEVRAESLGYDVARLRTISLTAAGALGGLAGALYAPVEGFIYPNQFGLVASTSFIVWVAVGGRGTLIGALVGAVLVNGVQSRLSDRFEELWPLLIGVFLVLVILFQPGGLVGGIRQFARRAGRHRA